MKRDTRIREVTTVQTSGGSIRYVVRDQDANVYTTFRDAIGEAAQRLEGQRVRIEYHEEQRGQYKNVYVDKVELLAPEEDVVQAHETNPEEAAWRTAVDAAPWLVGESEPHAKTDPEELYETLKPFKDRVADDIKDGD